MAKKGTTKSNKKKTTTNNKKKRITSKIAEIKKQKKKYGLWVLMIFLVGVLLIFSAYAWFSTNLNVKIRTFRMTVTRNSGLSISLDAVNYSTYVEISEQTLINDLKSVYPNNMSQWANNGLTPVSSRGIPNNNTHFFEIYASSGVIYKHKTFENGYIKTALSRETEPNSFNNFIAFDVFFKNVTGSPVNDNLYFTEETEIAADGEVSEEMQGLVNSVRLGIVKVGSTTINAPVYAVQNISCNNNCESIIFEPYSTNHTNLSIERASKYSVSLVNGESFPTFACIKTGGPIPVKDTVSGSYNLDPTFFTYQETITESNFDEPLFSIPNGITKARIYLWIEGQDIDSLETDSEGASLSVSISFIKDTQGYDTFD